jgi:heme A synthase
MSDALFQAHSGLRFLVLLAAAAAIVVLALGMASRRPYERPARIATAVFTGLLDLQILLGIALVALGRFYPSVLGHITMMVLAAVLAHALSVAARKAPDARRAHSLALIGVAGALVLIVLGIGAIGRGPFEMRTGAGSAEPGSTAVD